jgi:hypothetical protein
LISAPDRHSGITEDAPGLVDEEFLAEEDSSCVGTFEALETLEHACREYHRLNSAPRFKQGVLTFRGEIIARWKKMKTGPRPQLDVLTAFQEAKWRECVPSPDPDKTEQTVKDLNRKVRGFLHFSASWDLITWRPC